jgi:hypothetical protein
LLPISSHLYLHVTLSFYGHIPHSLLNIEIPESTRGTAFVHGLTCFEFPKPVEIDLLHPCFRDKEVLWEEGCNKTLAYQAASSELGLRPAPNAIKH